MLDKILTMLAMRYDARHKRRSWRNFRSDS